MAVVDDEEVVVSLFSFDLLFVAFDSSSFCGDSGPDVVVVVVEVEVVALVVVGVCFASLTPSSSFFFSSSYHCCCCFHTARYESSGMLCQTARHPLAMRQWRSCPPLPSTH